MHYCKLKGILLSGPSLGILRKDPSVDKRAEYIDNVDCVEVERVFSLSKRGFGMGLSGLGSRNYVEFHCALDQSDEYRHTGESLFVQKHSSGIFKIELWNKGRDPAVYST